METPQSNRLRRVGLEPTEDTDDRVEQFVYMEDGPFWLVPVGQTPHNYHELRMFVLGPPYGEHVVGYCPCGKMYATQPNLDANKILDTYEKHLELA